MQRLSFYLRCLVISCALLDCSSSSHADTCVLFHKRAPVKAVCGRVINIAGEKLDNVELTLPDETGPVLFTTRSDTKGSFSFGLIPKGDYTLHVIAPGYHVVERQIRVTNTNEKKCSPKIDVRLGFDVCDSGTRVTGVDKLSDLDF
jgi:hypothetical protein